MEQLQTELIPPLQAVTYQQIEEEEEQDWRRTVRRCKITAASTKTGGGGGGGRSRVKKLYVRTQLKEEN